MTEVPLRIALLATAVGGVIGSLGRYAITDLFEVTLGFPWPAFTINVVGSALLAAVPLLSVVRQRPWTGVFLGTGVLGGFTTMSAASEQTVVLLDHDRGLTALLYAGGTLAAAVLMVALVTRYLSPPEPDSIDLSLDR